MEALLHPPAQPGGSRTKATLLLRTPSIRAPQYCGDVLTCELRSRGQDCLFDWRVDCEGLGRLNRQRFGLRVLLTNRLARHPRLVLDGNAGQVRIERAFRGLTRCEWLNWGPRYHWTDSKFRVHAFCCLLGVSLLWWLHRRAEKVWPGLTLERLKKGLRAIQRIDWIRPPP